MEPESRDTVGRVRARKGHCTISSEAQHNAAVNNSRLALGYSDLSRLVFKTHTFTSIANA